MGDEPGGAQLWLRPGDDASSPYSARAFEHNIVVHSESAGLPSGAGQRLTRTRLYAHLWHGGDTSAAVRALLRGEKKGSLPQAVLDAIKAPASGGSGLIGDPASPREADVKESKAAPPAVRTPKVTRASEIVSRRLRWLWDLRIVLGGLTLIAGREGLGKSTIAVWLAALVTRGLLPGELYGTPRTVVYVNSEDARDYTIKPRLEAAGADLDRVIFVDAVMPGAGGEVFTESIVLPRDAHMFADLTRGEGAALVILHAATSVIESKLDGDKDRQMPGPRSHRPGGR